ncbi:MAG: hypothetical protein ACXVHB_06070 [Solirubrobacteraceae bacterium]
MPDWIGMLKQGSCMKYSGNLLLLATALLLVVVAPAAGAQGKSLTCVGSEESRKLGLGQVDLSAGEELFGIPSVPVWPEADIEAPAQLEYAGRTLAAFHGPHCVCGRPFGISYDLEAMRAVGKDPNEVLLHELAHAWQYYLDPGGSQQRQDHDVLTHGYWNAPHEVEARMLAHKAHAAGVRVWFP